MLQWNLGNLEAECKESLEHLLRPQFFGLIPVWIAKATNKEKQELVRCAECFRRRGLSRQVPLFVTKNSMAKTNAFGFETYANNTEKSVDVRIAEKNDFRRKTLGSLEKPPGTLGPTFRSGKNVADYFLLSQKRLRSERGTKLLNSQSLKDLEQWQQSDVRREEDQSQMVALIQELEHIFNEITMGRKAMKNMPNVSHRLYDESKHIYKNWPLVPKFEQTMHFDGPPPQEPRGRPPPVAHQEPATKTAKSVSNVYFPGGSNWVTAHNSFFVYPEQKNKIWNARRPRSVPHSTLTPRTYRNLRAPTSAATEEDLP